MLLQDPLLEQAAVRPDALAIITPSRRMTFLELARRAAGLAALLQERGARPNELVAVILDKGWEQVVATLGILQSGAAYLPLDPEWPDARIGEVLTHAGAKVAIVSPSFKKPRRWPRGVELLSVATAGEGSFRRKRPAPCTEADLAYVIYTSGSTGKPKGVMIEHGAARNTNDDINARFTVGPGDRVLGLSALSFDLSVYDIFGLLGAGGTLVLPAAEHRRDAAHWADLMQREEITLWNTVPAFLEMLVDYGQVKHANVLGSKLRLALLSGDWIPLTLPGRVRQQAPSAQVISLGGATEASIWSVFYLVGKVDPKWKSIPYGKPLHRQFWYVLDDTLEPCPVNVAGHLYIGGAGLARGYWRDPEKTANAFLIHPRSGARLYRTGDLGRMLPDGNLELLGREDLQVKIRGHRIELGEVETAIRETLAVRAAVVTVIQREGRNHALAAHIVPSGAPGPQPDEAQRALRQRLPEYMIPTLFVNHEELPLNANGKIDRQALATADAAGLSRGDYEPPRTPVEVAMAEVWAQVLKIGPIGARDNFLDLGGNSLLVMALLNHIRARFDLALEVRDIFEHPTIAQLAPVVEKRLLRKIAFSLP